LSQPRLRLDHIGIAVAGLAEARKRYAALLGAEPSPVEEVPSEGVRVSFFELAGCRIELLEAIAPDTPVGQFLAKRGSGVHHVSLGLEEGDIGAWFAELRARGVKVLGSGPRPGSGGSQVFFVHPAETDGVLLEFCQGAGEGHEGGSGHR